MLAYGAQVSGAIIRFIISFKKEIEITTPRHYWAIGHFDMEVKIICSLSFHDWDELPISQTWGVAFFEQVIDKFFSRVSYIPKWIHL